LNPDEAGPAPLRSSKPKVVAGGVAGSFTIVLVWIVGMLGVDVPTEVGMSFTVLVSFAAGYLKT